MVYGSQSETFEKCGKCMGIFRMMGDGSLPLPYFPIQSLDCGAHIDERQQRKFYPSPATPPPPPSPPPPPPSSSSSSSSSSSIKKCYCLTHQNISSASASEWFAVVSCRLLCCVHNKTSTHTKGTMADTRVTSVISTHQERISEKNIRNFDIHTR